MCAVVTVCVVYDAYAEKKSKEIRGGFERKVPDAVLKSPTMIKSVLQQQAAAPKPVQDPFRHMQDSIAETKAKIQKMAQTSDVLAAMPDNQTRKKFLTAENKVLRSSLQKMSSHLNSLLSKVQQENSRSPAKATPQQLEEAALQNSDKAILNLQKEKARLQKRLQQIAEPGYLLRLKQDLKQTEAEVKQQQALKKQLEQDNLKTDKVLGQVIEQSQQQDSLTQIQDLTQRMTVISEQILALHSSNEKAETLRS